MLSVRSKTVKQDSVIARIVWCSVVISYTLSTTNKIAAACIEVINQSKCIGCSFCCWLLEYVYGSCSCTRCFCMELTVILCYRKAYLCITVCVGACTRFITFDEVIAFFCKYNMFITADYSTICYGTRSTSDMNNGLFTKEVFYISFVAFE